MTTAIGMLVKVQGKNMHIRQMGSGEKTIVLLPGFAVPMPTVDFAPLMRELAKKHTVCTIDFFGYGLSDSTDTPRTNENYVEEIREALTLSGLKPPYVLMPYSCSGIYCEYYAAKYPDEVAGLILLDSSPTVEGFAKKLALTEEGIDEMKTALKSAYEPLKPLEEYEQAFIDAYYADYLPHGYTKEELHAQSKAPNDVETLVAQAATLSECVLEVMAMPIPKGLPILAFRSDWFRQLDDAEVDEDSKQSELEEYEAYYKAHMERLGTQEELITIIGSTHGDIYSHCAYRELICQKIDAFLEGTK